MAYLIHFVKRPGRRAVCAGCGKICVQCSAIGRCDARRIIGRLRAAFDLKRGHARLCQTVEMTDHAKIIGVEDITAVRILHNRKILARPLFLHKPVAPAARLGAFTPVGVATGQVAAEQAPAGHRHTHRPMHKRLKLQLRRGARTDRADRFQRQLAREYDA